MPSCGYFSCHSAPALRISQKLRRITTKIWLYSLLSSLLLILLFPHTFHFECRIRDINAQSYSCSLHAKTASRSQVRFLYSWATASCPVSSAAYLNSSSSNLQPPNTTASCVKCAIFLDLSPSVTDIALMQHLWWTTAISAILITVQYNVIRYNNTTVSNYRTIFNDYTDILDSRYSQPVIASLSSVFGGAQYETIEFLNANVTDLTDSNHFPRRLPLPITSTRTFNITPTL